MFLPISLASCSDKSEFSATAFAIASSSAAFAMSSAFFVSDLVSLSTSAPALSGFRAICLTVAAISSLLSFN